MIFTVAAMPEYLEALTDLWLKATDPQAITRASDSVDRLLREDGHQKGQPFFGNRILVVTPLAVTFSVSLDDRMITLLQVRLID